MPKFENYSDAALFDMIQNVDEPVQEDEPKKGGFLLIVLAIVLYIFSK